LLESESAHAREAALLLSVATRDLIRGQVQDLAFERRNDVTVAECLDMAAGKTGALLAASASIGAVLAGAAPATVARCSAFGAHLGWPSSWWTTCWGSGATRRSPASRSTPTALAQEVAAG